MIAVSCFDDIIKTTYIVSLNGKEHSEVKTIEELKSMYKAYLDVRQPSFKALSYGNFIDFSNKSVSLVKESFKRKSGINDLGQSDVVSDVVNNEDAEIIKTKIEEALELIKTTDENLYHIFYLVINKIVVSKSNKNLVGMKTKGGTSQTSIGVIWLAIGTECSSVDFAELLIHEMTHTLVFLDEIRYGHFDYSEIQNEKTFCVSAILGMSRPLDKVYHSIVVSTSILEFRRKLGINETKVHPCTSKIVSDTHTAIESVISNNNARLTILERPLSIIKICKEAIYEECCV